MAVPRWQLQGWVLAPSTLRRDRGAVPPLEPTLTHPPPPRAQPSSFPDPIRAPQLLSLPPCLSFPCRRAEMEPSRCDPHARAGLTHLAHPHRARVRPAEPLDAPGPALPSAPGQSRPSGSKRVRVGAGLGRGRPRPPEPPPAAPIPVRPAPRDSGITPPSPACPGPALPLLPSQQPCCDMLCRAVPCRFAIPCPYTTPCFLTLLPVHPQLPSTPQSPGSRLGS